MPIAPPDPARLAGAARSILACPAQVSLVVEGVDDVLGDIADDADLGMQDLGGVPTFSCPPGVRLAEAAHLRRRALLTIDSGLGAPGTPDRDATLTLGGHLTSSGTENCPCCPEPRETLTLHIDMVVLTRSSREGDHVTSAPPVHVPASAFGSPEHLLNRGYLQRSVEHANACHHEELRTAVASTMGMERRDVIGVSLSHLDVDAVTVHWVTPEGAHLHRLAFGRSARTTEELGELLRRELHPGLC